MQKLSTKKDKVYLNPPSPSLRSPVQWVDCGPSLSFHGQNFGWFTLANNHSPVFCRPNPAMIAKRSFQKDLKCFCRGVRKILSNWRAIVILAVAKLKPLADCSPRKVKIDGVSNHKVGIQNKSGFAILSLCILLPLILVLIAILILLSFWLKNFWATQKICEESVLKAQKEMSLLVPKVLDFNSEILQLRAQRTRLQISLAVAIATPAAPAIAAQLKLVQARLAMILAEQTLIFQKASFHRWSALSKFQSQSREFKPLGTRRTFEHPLSLALNPDQLVDLPPTYKAPENFLDKQRLEIQWTQNLFQNSEQTFIDLLSLKTPAMKRSCAASLQQKRRSWVARLIKGKDWSNYSY